MENGRGCIPGEGKGTFSKGDGNAEKPWGILLLGKNGVTREDFTGKKRVSPRKIAEGNTAHFLRKKEGPNPFQGGGRTKNLGSNRQAVNGGGPLKHEDKKTSGEGGLQQGAQHWLSS